MWRGENGPAAGDPSPSAAPEHSAGCGAPRTICACLPQLLLPSRRNSLHRELQSEISHGGTERTEKSLGRDLRIRSFKFRSAGNSFPSLCFCVSVAIFLSSCGYHVG